ncbi:MAG: ABC transporter substrate-binding protein [Marinobacter sp.]|nr:ABC transporter substrate-binding protein [Marinobacter sp.]
MAATSLRHLLLALLVFLPSTVLADKTYVIGITQIVEHPALDAVTQGVRDELAERGYEPGKNIRIMFESAQGNTGTAAQIARKFVGERPDAIIAIATPSAQTVAAVARQIPVVFSAVTDPVGARLVPNLEAPGGNITGITDMILLAQHIDFILRVAPDTKTFGTVYNPGEANAVALVELLEKALAERGLRLEKAAATRTSEVLGAARSLVGKVDAIYITTDNTVVSAAEAVISVGERARIPVFAADTATVARGAIAALGFDYYDVGRQTGVVVSRILEGERPGDIPVQGIDRLSLHVNLGAAGRMGIKLSDDIIAEAERVIE